MVQCVCVCVLTVDPATASEVEAAEINERAKKNADNKQSIDNNTTQQSVH